VTRASGPSPAPGREPAGAGASAASLESLYPFIYQGSTDIEAVLSQARASTAAKIGEVMNLRAEVCARSGEMLGVCAKQAAARFSAGGRLLTFGNGGSATDAQQIATLFLYPGPDPTGSFRPLPAIGLASDPAVLTALANDIGVEVVFARQVAAFGRPGDIALGLSTSGNSENLLRAFDEASRRGLMTIGIAGYDGGKMAELESLDFLFVAPSASIHRIQEAQTTIYHILWELIIAEMDEPVPR
jgi:D-sedoheptulose 7-phosphate isomerase